MCRKIKCNGTDFWEWRMWWASPCSPRRNKLPRDHLLLPRRSGWQISSPRAQFIIILSLQEKNKLFLGQRCQAPCIKWVVSYFRDLSHFLLSGQRAFLNLNLSTHRHKLIYSPHSLLHSVKTILPLQSGISPSPWENGPVLPGGFSLMFFLHQCLFSFTQFCLCSFWHHSRPQPR